MSQAGSFSSGSSGSQTNVQVFFGLVDGLSTGITNIKTFTQRFVTTAVILEPVAVTGSPDFSTFEMSFGTNPPDYTNFQSIITALPGPDVYDLTFIDKSNLDGFSGNIAPGESLKVNITSPVLVATVYTFRFYIQGFFF